MRKSMRLSRANRGLKKQFFAAVLIGAVLAGIPVPGAILTSAWAQAVENITTTPKVYSLNPCETKEFKAAVKGKDGKTIKDAKVVWESTDPGVATIDKNGIATGRTPGYTFIRPKVGQVKGEAASLFIRNKGNSPSC